MSLSLTSSCLGYESHIEQLMKGGSPMKRVRWRILFLMLVLFLLAASSCSPSALLGIESPGNQEQAWLGQPAAEDLLASKFAVQSRFGDIVTIYDWRLTSNNNFYGIVHYAQERDYEGEATLLASAIILAGRELGAARSCLVDTWNRDGRQELLAMLCASGQALADWPALDGNQTIEEFFEQKPIGIWWIPFTDELRTEMIAELGQDILLYAQDEASFQRIVAIADFFDWGYWETIDESPPSPPAPKPS